MTILRVALAQIASTPDPAANLALIADRVAEAAAARAQLVVFPEAAMRRFGGALDGVAEAPDGPWATQLAALAETAGVVVLAGMFTPGRGGRVRNTLRALGPDLDAVYDKVHLFDAFGFAESDTVTAGTEPVVIDVAGTAVGLTLCYDVRFPGLYTELADRGAQVIVVAASWGGGPGKLDHWQLLTRARALDSTCFVVACGQADPDDAELSARAPVGVGHSCVVGPRGEVLAELGAAPALLVVDLDLAEVAAARADIPVLANPRF